MGHFAGRGIKLQLSVATTVIATTVRLSLANVALQLVCDTALPCSWREHSANSPSMNYLPTTNFLGGVRV
jgi:hypothetical protein